MADSAIDNELNKYFSLLSPAQKESLLGMLKTFFPLQISGSALNNTIKK
jgi:hypothetical protein